MTLMTRDEVMAFRPLRDPDILLRAYLTRWAEHVGARIDLEQALRRAVDACFGRYVYNTWLHSIAVKLVHDADCIAFRLLLLQMGVVPETPFGADPEVANARALRANPDSELADLVAYGLAHDLQGWLHISEPEAILLVGGPGTIGARLRSLPAAVMPAFKFYRDATTWVLLYHYGVTHVTPPNFDDPALWDSLPDGRAK